MHIVTARFAGGIAVNLPCSYFITPAKGPHEIYVGLCCFINMPLKDLKESLKVLKSVWINVSFWCIFVSVVLWPHAFLQHAPFGVVSTSISSLCMSGMMGSSCSPFVQVDFNGTSQRSQTQRCLVKTWPVNWKFKQLKVQVVVSNDLFNVLSIFYRLKPGEMIQFDYSIFFIGFDMGRVSWQSQKNGEKSRSFWQRLNPEEPMARQSPFGQTR